MLRYPAEAEPEALYKTQIAGAAAQGTKSFSAVSALGQAEDGRCWEGAIKVLLVCSCGVEGG